VMLRIHQHADELTKVAAIGGWIHQIARNAIIDHYRRAVVRRERPVGSGFELDRPATALPEPGPADLRAEPSRPRPTPRRSGSPTSPVIPRPKRPP
jgi:DNA-directed RNA polymerase specialized sigma24 family protein